KEVDGFRCDMAEMVPVEFWEWVIPQVKEEYPHIIFIAEVYNPAEYRNYLFKGKFDYLYDKVGLYDTLRNIICGHEPAKNITRCWQSLNGIEKRMLNFLENHDEQRIASDFFAGNPQKAIPAFIVAACMNTNPIMLYFGQELGEEGMDNEGFSGCDGRTTIFDYWSVNTIRRWRDQGDFSGNMLNNNQKHLRNIYQVILRICNEEKAISRGAFFDLMYANENGWRFNDQKQYVFLRKHQDELLLIAVNFDNSSADIAINLPSHAFDYLQIQPIENCLAEDLLTNKKENISFLPYKATDVSLAANSGKVLKIKL
ncbi:alpha-amylase, partial [Bacteroides sp. OttesenSCG-928-N06]|nr:alpha-amylase [Bacteroides sp. OttesenSCG-928-N06]